MAVPPMATYGVKNCLLFAFKCLRSTDRLVDNSLQSPYELFHEKLAASICKGRKIEFSIPNSEVEAFYLKRSSETDFIASVQSKILSKTCQNPAAMAINGSASTVGGAPTFATVLSHFGPLFGQVWEMVCDNHVDICSKLPSQSGRHLWEIFLKLDTESELKVHVDDTVEVVLRIFKSNGHKESEENILKWFRGEKDMDFRAFFGPLVQKYVGLLQVNTIAEVNREIVTEFFKEGKLEKKGHVVHNWKMRWFVLTGATLTYYETQEKAVAKGCLVINRNAVVQNMPEYRARPHRFRVICGESRTVTEISAMDAATMQDWVYTIRMVIKMNQTPGRNFLHKWKQVSGSKVSRKGVAHSTSMDKVAQPPNHPPPKHRGLSATKSFPDARVSSPEVELKAQVSVSPASSEDGSSSPQNFISSASYTDAPPLPPQRFSPDIQDLSSTQILDKEAVAEKRLQHREDTRRHSSVDVTDIEHIVVGGEDYAVVKKSPKANRKMNKELSALVSPSVASRSLADVLNQPGKGFSAEEASLNANSPSKTRVPVPANKKLSSASQSSNDSGGSPVPNDRLDYAVVDVSAKKKKSMEPSKSPKPRRKNQDLRPFAASSPSSKTNEGHDETDNGLNLTPTAKSRKKPTSSTLSAPSAELHSQDGEVRARSESPEPRRGMVMTNDKPGEKQPRKIEYSTVVFPNSHYPANPTEKAEIKDFDRTKFDYSTVVFKGLDSLDPQDQRDILKSGGSAKKSIYDSDDEAEVDDPPYVNVRRDGRPMNAKNIPPIVPPRRGVAAITDESA